mgnify:CR=1 FL=1
MKFLIPVAIFAAAAISATAATAADFESIVNLVVKYNHGLRSESGRLAAEVSEARAENMLADPEAEGEMLFPQGGGKNRWSVGLTQSFDWPGAYKARRHAADAIAELNGAIFKEQLYEARYEVRRDLIEIISATKETAALREISVSMDELLARYRTAWDKGEATILDLNKLMVEAARAKAAVSAAEAERQRLITETFNAVPEEERPAPDSFAEYPLWKLEPYDEYLQEAMTCSHAEIIAAQGKLAEAEASVTRAGRYPSFALGYRHAFEDGTHFNGFSVGIGLPVYSRRHTIEASQARVLAAANSAKQLENDLVTELKADYIAAESLAAQMRDMGPAVENADNLRLLRRAFDGGELSLLDYLREVNFFREALLEYNSLRRAYLLRIASLSRH